MLRKHNVLQHNSKLKVNLSSFGGVDIAIC